MDAIRTLRAGLPLLSLTGPFAFIFMIVFSPAGLTPEASGDPLMLTPREQSVLTAGWMALVGIALVLVCSVASKLTNRHDKTAKGAGTKRKRALAATSVAASLLAGTLAMFVHAPATSMIVSLLLGACCMVQLALCTQIGSRTEPRHMALGTSMALVMAALVNCVAAGIFSVSLYGVVLVCAICAACGLSLLRLAPQVSCASPVERDATAHQDGGLHRDLRALVTNDWQPLVGGAICALSFGLGWSNPTVDMASANPTVLLGGKVAGAVLLTLACLRLEARLITRSFDYVLAIAACTALLVWALGTDSADNLALFSLAGFSQVLFIGLLWVETSYTGRESRNPGRLPVMGVVVFMLAYVLGAALSYKLDAITTTQVIQSLLTCFVFALLVSSARAPETSLDNEDSPQYDRTFETRIGDICESYALSKRESEVLPYLVLGLSTTAIGARLYVSPQTIKSHAHRIYGKMGIHSHDELVEVFEGLGETAPRRTDAGKSA